MKILNKISKFTDEMIPNLSALNIIYLNFIFGLVGIFYFSVFFITLFFITYSIDIFIIYFFIGFLLSFLLKRKETKSISDKITFCFFWIFGFLALAFYNFFKKIVIFKKEYFYNSIKQTVYVNFCFEITHKLNNMIHREEFLPAFYYSVYSINVNVFDNYFIYGQEFFKLYLKEFPRGCYVNELKMEKKYYNILKNKLKTKILIKDF